MTEEDESHNTIRPESRLFFRASASIHLIPADLCTYARIRFMGGAIGGGQGGHGPSNNLVGGGHNVFGPPIFCTGIKNFNPRFNAKGREYVPRSAVLDVCTL